MVFLLLWIRLNTVELIPVILEILKRVASVSHFFQNNFLLPGKRAEPLGNFWKNVWGLIYDTRSKSQSIFFLTFWFFYIIQWSLIFLSDFQMFLEFAQKSKFNFLQTPFTKTKVQKKNNQIWIDLWNDHHINWKLKFTNYYRTLSKTDKNKIQMLYTQTWKSFQKLKSVFSVFHKIIQILDNFFKKFLMNFYSKTATLQSQMWWSRLFMVNVTNKFSVVQYTKGWHMEFLTLICNPFFWQCWIKASHFFF